MKKEELEKIKKELYLAGILQKEAEFSCLMDGMATYYCVSNEVTHEINIICQKAILFKNMKIISFLEMDNILYLSYKCFNTHTEKQLGSSLYFKNIMDYEYTTNHFKCIFDENELSVFEDEQNIVIDIQEKLEEDTLEYLSVVLNGKGAMKLLEKLKNEIGKINPKLK